jgi:hypothetical protein
MLGIISFGGFSGSRIKVRMEKGSHIFQFRTFFLLSKFVLGPLLGVMGHRSWVMGHGSWVIGHGICFKSSTCADKKVPTSVCLGTRVMGHGL